MILSLTGAALAADHTLAIEAGPQALQVVDQQASPLRYGGPGGRLALEWRRQSEAWRLEAGLGGGLASLTPAGIGARRITIVETEPYDGEERVIDFQIPSGAALGDAQLALLRPLGPSIWLGAALEERLGYSAAALALHPWAYSALSLEAALRVERALPGGGALWGGAELAALGLVTRMPWSNDPLLPDRGQVTSFFASGSELAGPGRWRRLDLAVGGARPAGAWSLGLEAAASLWGYPDPHPVQALEAHLGLRVARGVGQ